MMKMRNLAVGAVLASVTQIVPVLGQSSKQGLDEPRAVIENDWTDLRACFANARNEVIGKDAISPCTRAIKNTGLSVRKHAIAYANRGVINFNMGNYEAAIEDFTASLDRDIHVRARVLTNRGLAYEALRFDALARADYKAALEIKKTEPTALRRLEELSKPLYERNGVPRRITAEAETPNAADM